MWGDSVSVDGHGSVQPRPLSGLKLPIIAGLYTIGNIVLFPKKGRDDIASGFRSPPKAKEQPPAPPVPKVRVSEVPRDDPEYHDKRYDNQTVGEVDGYNPFEIARTGRKSMTGKSRKETNW